MTSIVLDGLLLILGGGEAADTAPVLAGTATSILRMLADDVKGVAAGEGGVAIGAGGLFKEGMSNNVGKAFSIVGTVVGAYATKHDFDNIEAEYARKDDLVGVGRLPAFRQSPYPPS